MAPNTESWTTIIVGRDGEVFDLSKNEYPPKTRDNKTYYPWFGMTVPVDRAAKLQQMSHKEVKQLYTS